MYIYIHMYIYICSHENNVSSWLSPQWHCGNSCTWAHDRALCTYVHMTVHTHDRTRTSCTHDRALTVRTH